MGEFTAAEQTKEKRMKINEDSKCLKGTLRTRRIFYKSCSSQIFGFMSHENIKNLFEPNLNILPWEATGAESWGDHPTLTPS